MTVQVSGELNVHLYQLVNGLACKNPLLDGVMIFLARCLILLLPVYLLYLWFAGRGDMDRRKVAILVVLSSLLSLGIALGISSAYYHPRPFAIGLGHTLISHAADSSFPSDHASVLFAASFSLAMLGSRRSGAIFFFISSLVGLARVFVGIHFPGDIAGGLVVGLVSSTAVFSVRGRLDSFILSLIRMYQRLARSSGSRNWNDRSDSA